MKRILNKEVVDEIADKLVKFYETDINQNTIKNYEKQLSSIENEIEKCFKLMLVCVDDPEMLAKAKSQSKDLSIRKADIQQELSKLKLANGIKHTKDDIIGYLNFMLENGDKKFIIDNFVNAVFVFDDKILICYKVFGDKIPTHQEMLETLSENGVLVPNALAGVVGFEPTRAGVKVPCLTAWRHPNVFLRPRAVRA